MQPFHFTYLFFKYIKFLPEDIFIDLRNIIWLPPVHARLGIEPTTQLRALTRDGSHGFWHTGR